MFDNSPIEDDKNRKIQTFVFGLSLIHIAQFEQICKILFYIIEFEEK